MAGERLPDNFADWPRLASLGPIATARSYAEIAQHQDELYARRRRPPRNPQPKEDE